ncbi:MAG: 2OG-Fe(II) oxygenase, partial [SAR116 cluster bacterium]|nr:2OG-Fe(II) oxygenase [SAR116 cluster bacterium]
MNEIVKKLDFNKIPIIDLKNLRNGKNKFNVAKELHDASKNLGFIYVKNHG